jgi:hypothetical protein
MSLYAVELSFPFTGNKGPRPNHEKQPETIIPHPPNVTVGAAFGQVEFFMASAKHRFVRWTAR